MWRADFETGDFRQWSWWGQGDPSWGHIAVIRPAEDGIPPGGGAMVARFETTPDDIAAGRYHAKLYRGFGTHVGFGDSRSPSDVSGTYSAWYYVPRTYHVPHGTSMNLFQFKEKHRDSGGERSDPQWWIQLGDASWAAEMAAGYGQPLGATAGPAAPVAFVSHPSLNWSLRRTFIPLPLGRWFEVTAVVEQGRRITFSIDGRLLGSFPASEHAVGPEYGAASMEWIFGVGNYSTGANGPLYVDDAAYATP